MKNKITICLAAFIFLLMISCSKNAGTSKDPTAAVLGKWDLISDSTFQGVGQGNHAVNYIGKAGDYFDFRTDGKVYLKENTIFDTLSYSVLSNSTIVIESFGIILNGIPEISQIKNLTVHSATIYAPDVITPGGLFGRTVHLSK